MSGVKFQRLDGGGSDLRPRAWSSDDAVTLLSFSDRVRILGEMADSSANGRRPRSRASPREAATALVDADASRGPGPRRSAPRPVCSALVFSDGDDRLELVTTRVRRSTRRASPTSWCMRSASQPSRAGGATGWGPPRTSASPGRGRPGPRERLTQATGGRLWFADTPLAVPARALQLVLEEVRERDPAAPRAQRALRRGLCIRSRCGCGARDWPCAAAPGYESASGSGLEAARNRLSRATLYAEPQAFWLCSSSQQR